MSIAEIVVILIVAILICKPEDIKLIVTEFYRLKNYLFSIKKDLIQPITDELEQISFDELKNPNSINEINFYLKKIANLNQSYNGDYSLDAVKKYYYQLIKNKQQ